MRGAIPTSGKRQSVTEGLETTFEVLSTTRNEAAVRVLVPAVDSACAAIRQRALRAILARRSPAGHRELLRRLHTLDKPSQEILREHLARMAQALRDAVVGSDPQLCANGCRAAVWFREYDLIPALVNALENPSNPNAALAGKTLLQLVGRLYAELAGPRRGGGGRDCETIRRRVLTALEGSIERFSGHRRREILEAFLLLVGRDNAVLKRILEDPHNPAFFTLIDVLSNSSASGVIGLLLAFLDRRWAPSAALDVVARRCDFKFLRYLLRKTGEEPSAALKQNLKRIESIPWLGDGPGLLDQLEEAAQHAAIRLLMLSGVPRTRAFPIVRYLLREGKPLGRRAAAEALKEFQGSEANALALEALDDEDPDVQAQVAVQLRGRGIVGALPRLVRMIDSPHAVVREAVRTSLREFSFQRFLTAFDMLDDQVRKSTGMLVKKIDPDTIPGLHDEMESRVRPRRLRAVAIAMAIDVVGELEETLTGLLYDDDHLVRAEAAKALARGDSRRSWQALEEALNDRSPVVQEAARNSLRQRPRPANP
jgi:HEAT repeat protein